MRSVLVTALALAVAAPLPAADPPEKAAASRDAVALLRRTCFECHGPEKQRASLRLDGRDSILAGGESGPAVVPSKADKGELLRRVALPAGAEGAMPPRGARLTAHQVELLRDWIAAGAEWPAGDGKHWAYVPPKRPAVPEIRNPQSAIRNPQSHRCVRLRATRKSGAEAIAGSAARCPHPPAIARPHWLAADARRG